MHVVLLGTLAIGAQTIGSQATPPQPTVAATALVIQSKNPYGQIFRVPQRRALTPLAGPQNPNAVHEMPPRVVCGTVVVPVRPDADAKMLVGPKDDRASQTEYKIRKIAPTMCNE